MELCELDHIGIVTDDIKESAAFYCNVLNFKLIETREVDDMKIAYYTDGITKLEFLEPNNKKNIQKGIKHIAYRCKNIDKYAESFINNGIKIVNNKVNEYKGMKYIFSQISNDQGIELVEYKEEHEDVQR